MKQMNNIYQISFLEHAFPVNCYLVKEENELTLIDAALPYSAKKILKFASSIGKPITKILLTHGHDDHVGALDKLKDALPTVPVYISKRDSRLLAGDLSVDEHETNLPIRGGVPKKIKTKADIFIEDGDQIGSLRAIAAPGHTPGQMAFLDTRDNSIIAGDAFQTRGGIAVSGQLKLSFPFPALATWDKQAALTSARKIAELKPTLLAVGHGRMLVEPFGLINKAIKDAETKMNSNQTRSV
ncbi:MBL fold metallo-hydrolase [Aquibacillus halophilus]|uniref:MBL fold metallo-hydrolase n=1 Tax=Aquibacillus halophilus TaxID=930132 RepID=A0A6A8DF68_9BACI|nr:MBL fold metallo-hydrolase [Aquibacillus halophilus]MRH43870.1 MBL fold metallo-hydrolase [Aquibacillus halophilus]